MLDLENALQKILATLPLPASERVSLADACGRVLAESIVSPIDLPSFDNSAMDGYAMRAEDVKGASSDGPIRLPLSGKIAAGALSSGELTAGACVRVFTGSPMPRGAKAAVMQEDTPDDKTQPGRID